MGDGGDENNNEASLEGEDAAGGSQACGEGHVEGNGGAAASESCVWDAGGAAVAAVVDSIAGSLGGEAGALLLLIFFLSGSTGPSPGLF